jgi:glycosyltransferase involved in cell wall biosynthesis
MTFPPTISIIIPVFNREKYIGLTIESVLQQTFSDFELIIIDDGSTDDSVKEIEKYSDPRIRFFRQENRGLAKTWNLGLELSRGEFIKLLDSDDLMAPDFLQEKYSFASTHLEADVIYSNWYFINQNGEIISQNRFGKVPENYLESLLLGNIFGVHEVFFRKKALVDVGFFDPDIKVCEDWDLFIRLAKKKSVFSRLDKFLSFHRVHPGTFKKLLVDRFQQVLEKTFSAEDLLKRHLRMKRMSFARHQLFLLKDFLQWGWEEATQTCLDQLCLRINAVYQRGTYSRSEIETLLLPTWPKTIDLFVFFSKFFTPLRKRGIHPRFLRNVTKRLARSGLQKLRSQVRLLLW